MKTDYLKPILCVLIACCFLTGCNTLSPQPVEREISQVTRCPLPSGNLVPNAFETAKETLSHPDCSGRFDEIFEALLNVCKGAPSLKNKKRFEGLLVWAKNQGIITTLEAKHTYNRYFKEKFISLPSEYQTCSYCLSLSKILEDGQIELKDKYLGLVKVCGDQKTYAKAGMEWEKIGVILEAACLACDSQ